MIINGNRLNELSGNEQIKCRFCRLNKMSRLRCLHLIVDFCMECVRSVVPPSFTEFDPVSLFSTFSNRTASGATVYDSPIEIENNGNSKSNKRKKSRSLFFRKRKRLGWINGVINTNTIKYAMQASCFLYYLYRTNIKTTLTCHYQLSE